MPDHENDRPRRIWEDGIDMAYALIERHPELLADCPSPSDILFVLDTVSEPSTKGRPTPAKVSKISGKLTDFLEAGEKTWMIEWFTQNNGWMTRNQCYILLLQQLLLFEAVGDSGDCRIGGWDIQELEVIADRVGLKWSSDKHGEPPDIMAPGFEWGRVGQSRIKFIQARTEERRQRAAALGGAAKPKAEQLTLEQAIDVQRERISRALDELYAPPQAGGIYLKPTERATLHVGGDGPPALTIEGPDGKREIPAVTVPAQPDDWQPTTPYVKPDNVVQFPGSRPETATGTNGNAG
jgi:hypothetical protein